MVILLFFNFISLTQILILWFLFRKMLLCQEPKQFQNNSSVGVSVIIAAHNEYPNLQKLIPALLAQNYSTFEIIVANDRSTDDTFHLLETLSLQNLKLKIIHIQEVTQGIHPKKNALVEAINKAEYDILLLTDADCLPASKQWIQAMANRFDASTAILLGFSPYNPLRGWLNKLIQFETFFTALQYFSFALVGMPYMGVGRNLAYRKQTFRQASKNFAQYQHVVGGDDDLFINQIANAQNTKICINPASFVYSVPKVTWQSWLKQKKRHLSVGKYYKPKHLFFLGIIQVSLLLFYLFFVLSLINFALFFDKYMFFLLILPIIRQVLMCYIYAQASKKLSPAFVWYELLVLEIIFVLYWHLIAIWANMSSKITWK